MIGGISGFGPQPFDVGAIQQRIGNKVQQFDTDENGALSAVEFEEFFANSMMRHSGKSAEEVFGQIDTDANGEVSSEELFQNLSQMRETMQAQMKSHHQDRMQEILKAFDLDESGSLSKGERAAIDEYLDRIQEERSTVVDDIAQTGSDLLDTGANIVETVLDIVL